MNHVKTSNRIHALDFLRAIMMLLGIVLHSSESYLISESDLWPRDPSEHTIFLNYLNSLIHIFRMPVFFVMAGFFSALLFYERGEINMLKNRFQRIVLPFVVFLFLLHPFILLVLQFTSDRFGVTLTAFSTVLTPLPKITYHLWFLYYYALLSFFTYSVAILMRKTPSLSTWVKKIFEYLIQRRLLAIVVFSILLFSIMVYIWDYGVPTPISFIPSFGSFLFFLLFFWTGWILFKTKQLIFDFVRYDRFLLFLAVLLYVVRVIWAEELGDVLVGMVHALMTWMFIFGFIGLFIRYGNSGSARVKYLSDASYWVFLIHLPFTILIPGLIIDWPLPALIKFLITLTGTTLICFITYRYLVRSTFIGQLLNGKKYTIRKELKPEI